MPTINYAVVRVDSEGRRNLVHTNIDDIAIARKLKYGLEQVKSGKYTYEIEKRTIEIVD